MHKSKLQHSTLYDEPIAKSVTTTYRLEGCRQEKTRRGGQENTMVAIVNENIRDSMLLHHRSFESLAQAIAFSIQGGSGNCLLPSLPMLDGNAGGFEALKVETTGDKWSACLAKKLS